MRPTNHVRFWEIKILKPGPDGKKRKRPYGVRWVTAGREHSSWFTTKALANSELTKMRVAASQGEAFDIDSGLPESMYRERNSRTLLQVAQRFIANEWEDSAPNTRRRNVDTLAVAVGAFVKPGKGKPDERVMRRVLTTCLLPVNGAAAEGGSDALRAAAWLAENSRPVAELAEEDEMAALLRALGRNLGGKPAAAWTARTRRGVLHHALSYAVKLGELGANPVTGAKVVQRGNAEVDPRVVVNPQQARQVLAAVTYVGRRGPYEYLYGFFAAMYYAALRPCEVNRLRAADCTLPAEGWGELVLSASASRSNARYIDSGKAWEERTLKRRAQGAVRVVPIPPQLVVILRAHLDRFGAAEDGRLFRSARTGAPVNPTVYAEAWERARVLGLTPAQRNSPLARRPYDLRHAAVSTWLAAGVPAAEVAERAGHTVDVLLKVYARCLDGQRDNSNQRIAELLT